MIRLDIVVISIVFIVGCSDRSISKEGKDVADGADASSRDRDGGGEESDGEASSVSEDDADVSDDVNVQNTPNTTIQVTIAGERETISGMPITVTVNGDHCDDAEFLLELEDGGKTVWQKEGKFTLIFEQPGDYSFTGHVRCSTGRNESSLFLITVKESEIHLTTSQEWISAGQEQEIVFTVKSNEKLDSEVALVNLSNDSEYPMFDDGDSAHGDEIAGDGTYSCKFTAVHPEGNIVFQARTSRQSETIYSNYHNLFSIPDISDEAVEQSVNDIGILDAYVDEHAEGQKVWSFIEQFPETFDNSAQIESIAKSDDYILVRFEWGAVHLIAFVEEGTHQSASPILYNPGSSGYSIRSKAIPATAFTSESCKDPTEDCGPVRVKNHRVLAYSPSYEEFKEDDGGKIVVDTLSNRSEFRDQIVWLENEKVTIDSMTSTDGFNWENYGIIIFSGHYALGYLQLGERVSAKTSLKYKNRLGTIKIVTEKNTNYRHTIGSNEEILGVAHLTGKYKGESYYFVAASWLAKVNRFSKSGTFFYTDICYGKNIVLELLPEYTRPTIEISSALFGYDDLVDSLLASNPTQILFSSLADGERLSDIEYTQWDVCDKVCGTFLCTPCESYPRIIGNTNLHFFCPEYSSGSDTVQLVYEAHDPERDPVPRHRCVCPEERPEWNEEKEICDCHEGSTWNEEAEKCEGCGNCVINEGEACDDGNMEDDFICSADCSVAGYLGVSDVCTYSPMTAPVCIESPIGFSVDVNESVVQFGLDTPVSITDICDVAITQDDSDFTVVITCAAGTPSAITETYSGTVSGDTITGTLSGTSAPIETPDGPIYITQEGTFTAEKVPSTDSCSL